MPRKTPSKIPLRQFITAGRRRVATRLLTRQVGPFMKFPKTKDVIIVEGELTTDAYVKYFNTINHLKE